MVEKPPVVDVEFSLIEDRLRLRPGDVLQALWVGVYAWMAFEAHNPAASALLVVAAGLVGPLRRLFGSLGESVSWRQAEWLRQRMDPRQPWRARALKPPR
jgi:hypothetical protein